MGATASPASRHRARLGAFAALVVVAGLLLPLSAYAVEAIAGGAENWIIVVQLALMAAIGAGVGRLFGRLGPNNMATAPRMATWAAAGLLAALLADALWLLLLAG
ncbi:MAG TPA: hypothetical protein VM287_00135 [Egibacteraceae bacterium]|nr:hypothetical protein [Egibacteraceae bacterium]